MGLGGGEVEVHGHHVAGLDVGGGEDVLGGAALVRRQEVVHVEELAHLGGQAVVGLGAGVGVVGAEHGGLLEVAHRVDARVGQHVHEDVFVLQQEGVVAGLVHQAAALLHRGKAKLLDDADLVHLEGQLLAAVELDVGHGVPFVEPIVHLC